MKYPNGFRSNTGIDSFDIFFAIPSVVILYGNGHSFVADEHRHAAKLLRKLSALGRNGVRIRGMICHEGTLDRSSTRALNCYLRHCGGLRAYCFKKTGFGSLDTFSKFDWYDLCQLLNLRWTR